MYVLIVYASIIPSEPTNIAGVKYFFFYFLSWQYFLQITDTEKLKFVMRVSTVIVSIIVVCQQFSC